MYRFDCSQIPRKSFICCYKVEQISIFRSCDSEYLFYILVMSSYEEVVEKDIELLRSVQEYCYRTPWLNDTMSRIVSKNPLRDIVSVLWLFFIYGLVEIGQRHFWVVAMNLIGAFGKFQVDTMLLFNIKLI